VAGVIQPYLQAALGQPVQLAWVPGNSGITGASAVLGAEPDGHTVMLASSSLITAHEYLFGDQLPFKPRQDFAPITRVGETAVLLAIPNGRSWQTPAGTGRRDPRAARYAEGRDQRRGLHRPPADGHAARQAGPEGRGGDPAFRRRRRLQAQALVTGQVDMAIAAATGLLPLMRVGTARALATTGEYRAVWTPELELVPAVVESFPQTQLDVADWWGLVARSGTPAPALAAIAPPWAAPWRSRRCAAP
jgi:tripartite-type tricarboxylate transporter receptor subunit TctC